MKRACTIVPALATNAEPSSFKVLASLALHLGQILVMDNLTAQKGEWVRELIEHRGCELLYLPPYPPNFNPVEKAFLRSM